MIEGETPPTATILAGFMFHTQSGPYLNSVAPLLGQDVRDCVGCMQEAWRAGAVLHIYSGLCVLVFVIKHFTFDYHICMDDLVITTWSLFQNSSSFF